MSAMMHRSLRLAAFLSGLLVGGLSVLFAFDNPTRITLAVGGWQLQSIPLWSAALVPLVVGLAAGYLYHLPARMHHFTEHMRHRGQVHDLRKENEELSRSLDRLLAMPNDDTPAIAAAAAARDVTPAGPGLEPLIPIPVSETVAIAAGPVAEPGSNGGTNGHRPSRSERRTHARLLAEPESKRDDNLSAGPVLPAERHARAARSARARKAIPKQVDPS